jgi:hypothetical protein
MYSTRRRTMKRKKKKRKLIARTMKTMQIQSAAPQAEQLPSLVLSEQTQAFSLALLP